MTLRVVTFKLEEEVLEKLDILAKRKGIARSELIREAVRELIKRHSYEIATQKMLKTIAEIEKFRVY